MPSEILTDLKVKTIKPPAAGRIEVWDARELGLVLRVTSNGKKSWALQYRTNVYDGTGRRKTKKVTLGAYGEGGGKITLAEARRLAVKTKAAVADGEDPSQLKVEDRAAAIADGRRRNIVSLATAIERYARRHEQDSSIWKRHERPRILRRELAPKYGEQGIGELSLAQLRRQQAAIQNRGSPIMANRYAEAVRAFFKWAVEEYEIDNPAELLGRVVDESDFSRDRVLSKDELARIWGACETLTPLARDFVRVLMLTPHRVSTVASMRFYQIDDNGLWRIPKKMKKQKVNDQMMPLGARAYSIVKSRYSGEPDDIDRLVFCSNRAGDTALQATSKIKAALDRTLAGSVTSWRFHDFRRSFATWAASARIDQSIVRKILDHGQARRDRLDAIYNRFEYIDEQRDALNEYAKFFGVG